MAKEVISRLKKFMYSSPTKFYDGLFDDMNIAVTALEKQEPKAAVCEKGECYSMPKEGEGYGYEVLYKCPTCNSTELVKGYPCKCGQMLNWEDSR